MKYVNKLVINKDFSGKCVDYLKLIINHRNKSTHLSYGKEERVNMI